LHRNKFVTIFAPARCIPSTTGTHTAIQAFALALAAGLIARLSSKLFWPVGPSDIEFVVDNKARGFRIAIDPVITGTTVRTTQNQVRTRVNDEIVQPLAETIALLGRMPALPRCTVAFKRS
jgi:hypothetical protein